MDTNQSLDETARPVLITAAKEDTERFREYLSSINLNVLYTPLEIYSMSKEEADISDTLNKLGSFQNIVYGSKRNALFFVKQMKRYDKLESARNKLNLALDETTFEFLEAEGISAVHPKNSAKAIDLVEVMLRLKRLGATLYPCGTHKREEFPGLLEELDIPVTELDVFDLEGPTAESLQRLRKEVDAQPPWLIIFHSRRSVNRTLAAFPDLDYQQTQIVAADSGIAEKLEKKGIAVDDEAGGSWQSVFELIERL